SITRCRASWVSTTGPTTWTSARPRSQLGAWNWSALQMRPKPRRWRRSGSKQHDGNEGDHLRRLRRNWGFPWHLEPNSDLPLRFGADNRGSLERGRSSIPQHRSRESQPVPDHGYED